MVSSQLCATVSQHSSHLCNFVVDRDILTLYAPVLLVVIHAEEIDIILIVNQKRCNCLQSVLFYCKITLHVSGVVHTHHQEYTEL